MKNVRLRLVLVAGAAASLTACREPSGCPSGWCGTVVVAAVEPTTLMPTATQFDIDTWASDLIFSKLADIGPDMNTVGDSGFVPQLAAHWEFDNPTTLRFTLNPKAVWDDGVPVTAQDVAFTFDVYRDTLVNAGARRLLDQITSVTPVDSRTVVFRFAHRYPEELYDAVYQMRILPAHILDSVPRARLNSHPFGRHPIGSGPYRLVTWEPGQYVELAADSTYFLGLPGIRRVIVRVGTDQEADVNYTLAGDADITWLYGTPDMVQRVKQAPTLQTIPYAANAYSYIGFNFRDPARPDRPHPLFGDRNLRRAISMAVDARTVTRTVLGDQGEVPPGPITSMLWTWSDSLRGLPFDSAEARRALDQMGWHLGQNGVRARAGRRLEFDLLVPATSALRKRAAVIVQDQLRRVGIAMQISDLDLNTFIDRLSKGRFDAAFLSWVQDPSPRTMVQAWGVGQPTNLVHYDNPTFDRLTTEAGNEPDRNRARGLWTQALHVIDDDAPAVWLYAGRPMLVVQDRIEHITIRPDQWTSLLWTWRINPDSLLPRDRIVSQ
jgi:peptide/nickel transport system substrate-binding protein